MYPKPYQNVILWFDFFFLKNRFFRTFFYSNFHPNQSTSWSDHRKVPDVSTSEGRRSWRKSRITNPRLGICRPWTVDTCRYLQCCCTMCMSDNFTKNQKLLPSACLKITTFKCTFGKEWLMESEMRMSVFFHKKIDFFKVPETLSKCFPSYSDRLSGLVSASKWFWTYPHRLWKKSIFWWKNAHLVRNGVWGQKWEWVFFFS